VADLDLVAGVTRWLLLAAALILLVIIVWLSWDTPVDINRMR
jgi:hypothetical protein